MFNIYLEQIKAAQEFLHENHNADVSRLQCLLRKMMPETYYKEIDKISQVTEEMPLSVFNNTQINVSGGTNQIAPQAQSAELKNVSLMKVKDDDSKDYLKVSASKTILETIIRLLKRQYRLYDFEVYYISSTEDYVCMVTFKSSAHMDIRINRSSQQYDTLQTKLARREASEESIRRFLEDYITPKIERML